MCQYKMLAASRHKFILFTSHARFSLSAELTKSYYDALGVTPHATQNDIKTAYYKLSMKFHPDKNKDNEEAINSFRDITEAYEVLGNFRLKKLYDKGLLHTAGTQYSGATNIKFDEEDGETKFYKSRFRRDKAPPPTGRTPIYNFDEWSHAHYGETFARRAAAKGMQNNKIEQKKKDTKDVQSEVVVFGLIFSVLSFYLFNHLINETHDVVDISVKEEKKT